MVLHFCLFLAKNPVKFRYLELFSKIFDFGPFHWKSAILSLAMMMTSLLRRSWDVGTYFDMYGKNSPLAILWYQLHVYGGFHF